MASIPTTIFSLPNFSTASQYTDVQLRIISKFLPLNVRAVLEEQSTKYQQVISFNSKVSDNLREKTVKKETNNSGTSEKLLKSNNKEKGFTKPVVIPSSVNMNSNIKLAKKKNEIKPIGNFEELEDIEEIINEQEEKTIEQPQEPAKRGRGRPRKNPVVEATDVVTPKRGKGRPRKNPIPEQIEDNILSVFEDEEEETILPGFEEIPEDNILPDFEDEKEETILPGFEDEQEEKEDDVLLPGFQEIEEEYSKEKENEFLSGVFGDTEDETEENILGNVQETKNEYRQEVKEENNNEIYENIDISNLLTADKKVACFVGTSNIC